jgi:choice-of-anchor C domain-containing protein
VLRIALACTVGILASPLAASASLVLNGSFEDVPAAQPFQTIYAGGSLGGWTVTAGSVDLINGYWLASDQNQSVDMSGFSRGTIEQTITASAGTYHLTFDLSGNSDGPPVIKTLRVLFGGVSRDFTFATTGSIGNMNWASQSWDVTTVSANPVLAFQDISDNASGRPYFGAVLDNVSVVAIAAVPEPTTMVVGALALFPLAFSTLRILRRKRAV